MKPPGCCEACGIEYKAPVRTRLTFGEAPNDGPDVCPKCGRPLVVRIVIRYTGEPDDKGTEVSSP